MRFPIVFGTGLAAALMLLSWMISASAPVGTQWLGNTIQNTSDAAVYYSYLKQGADGHVLLENLYAVEPHAKRFDFFWSTLALVARSRISPIIIYEGARVVCVMFLVFSLWAAAMRLWRNPRDAALATVLSIGGISTGWLYTLWLWASHGWHDLVFSAPDLVSEFSFGPILIGGPHMIFSAALLITTISLVWHGTKEAHRKTMIKAGVAGLILTAFHPYFIPLIALIGIMSVLMFHDDVRHRRARVINLLIAGTMMLPALIYYVWLLQDPIFGQHHLVYNDLPLGSPLALLCTILPFIVAGIWMGRSKKMTPIDWRFLWIISSVLLLLFLPVPWKRKLTEALIVPFVFLTMPAWQTLRDYIQKQRDVFLRITMFTCFFLFAWFTPLQLVMSGVAWYTKPSAQAFFYASTDVFHAASWIHDQKNTSTLLLADDRLLNIWLPALSGKHVWYGHDHETPDFSFKKKVYQQLQKTSDAERAQTILKDAAITHFITTSPQSKQRYANFLSPTWHITYEQGSVAVWESVH